MSVCASHIQACPSICSHAANWHTSGDGPPVRACSSQDDDFDYIPTRYRPKKTLNKFFSRTLLARLFASINEVVVNPKGEMQDVAPENQNRQQLQQALIALELERQVHHTALFLDPMHMY